ncbi:MAG: ATP12 family protein [Candidatus Pacebacteria bacterium]|nr:ATP12 family protein [Candidatus Paceibacterota bacterium]
MKRKFHEVKAEAVAAAQGQTQHYRILLDGVAIKTPVGHQVQIAEVGLTNELVREWAALPLNREIDFAALPMTAFVFALQDRIVPEGDKFIAAVAKKISFDLLLHPADKPVELVARQNQHWTPLVEWAERRLKTPLPINLTVMPRTANSIAEQRVMDLMRGELALPHYLLAAHQIVDICGSTILALAVLDGEITEVERLFDLAFMHDEYQLEVWGEDLEARHRLEGIGDSLLELWRFLELASGIVADE